MGITNDIFSLVKRLSKMTFPNFKRMHSELVNFSFFHANIQNDFSLFIQLKLSFKSVLCYCYSSGFFRCMVTFLGDYLNFQNLFVRNEHQFDFFFHIKTLIS
jgi:hypothetical protein